MLKKIVVFMLVVSLCSVAFAADPALTGKVTAVGDGKVTISVEGDKPAWVKKNAPVKFTGGVGKVLEVQDATPVVVVFKTKSAADVKVGDTITLQKGKAMAGC